ncbi:MAG: UDP-2,3-diacylglucosamine diphosphatase LpxI [Phycisphaerae bacterium]|nr:UDP-2,3-diacylglucosamine diphosphatase LpxI [Phycisphaerae bacterium]
MSTNQNNTIGLIAGQGRLPFLVAQGAKAAGLKVICVGFAGQVDPELANYVDKFYTAGLARPGAWIRKLKKHNCRETIMVGRVAKKKMYTPFRLIQYIPDWRGIRVLYSRLKHDKRNDSVLSAIADELATGDIILVDSTKHIKDSMATAGLLTKTQPSESITKDITFGWSIVKQMGNLDIGQAIAVKDLDVIAVEAIEGTDKMIERAGSLCPSGKWTLIKTGKPDQDMRFDVPTIGTWTIENLKKNGAKCLAIEAEKTIIVDKDQTLALADKYKIAIVGCED